MGLILRLCSKYTRRRAPSFFATALIVSSSILRGRARPTRAFAHRATSIARLASPVVPPPALVRNRPRRFAGRAPAIMASPSGGDDGVPSPRLEYVDAGANLLDPMYRGAYHGKPRHEPDLDIVLRRAHERGVSGVISLAGTIKESEELMELIEGLDEELEGGQGGVRVFGTVGVHPTRCAEVFAEKEEPPPSNEEGKFSREASWVPKKERQRDEIIRQLIRLAEEGKASGNVVAIGECGLDYARLQFCPKEMQQLGLRAQLQVACKTRLPIYLHNRESGEDLYGILLEHRGELGDGDGNIRGIVHSFDESAEIAERFMSLGLYIGINGCSLKTVENLEVVKWLPLERLILETDCPWCDIRPSHAGAAHVRTAFPTKKDKQYNRELGKEFCVKNRTEPCHVAQVAEVVAGVKGLDVREVVKVCNWNVRDLFHRLEKKRRVATL